MSEEKNRMRRKIAYQKKINKIKKPLLYTLLMHSIFWKSVLSKLDTKRHSISVHIISDDVRAPVHTLMAVWCIDNLPNPVDFPSQIMLSLYMYAVIGNSL